MSRKPCIWSVGDVVRIRIMPDFLVTVTAVEWPYPRGGWYCTVDLAGATKRYAEFELIREDGSDLATAQNR